MYLWWGSQSFRRVLQGLSAPITDMIRLRGTDQRLYLYASPCPGGMKVLGGLKVGLKKLFIRTVSDGIAD